METLEKKIAAEEARRNVLRKESEKSKEKIIRLVDIQEMVFREYSVVEAQELKAVQLRHLELLMNRQSKSAEPDVEASDLRQQYESSVQKLGSDLEELHNFYHGLGKYEKKDEQIRALEASIEEVKKKISQESALLKGKIGLLNDQKENGLLTKNVFSKLIDKLTHELSLLKKPFLAADESQFQKVGMSKDKINAYLDKLVEHINNQNDYVVDEDIDDVKDEPQESPVEEEEEIVESDIELEGDLVEPDNDPYQKMGDPSVEVSEENHDASQEFKGQAMEAISDGKLEEAIEHLTHAILLDPTSAIMCATRATVYTKMKKPNAAIRDATAALEINPDSAKGYKSRGIARAMLGQWEEAAKDLHVASKLDCDEEIVAALKKVETNAHKIEEHRRKYDRLRKEREDRKSERDRQRHRAEAQAAYEKAKKQEQSSSSRAGSIPGGFPGGMPGGFPGMGRGMPGDFPTGMGGGMPAGMGGGMPAGMGGGMPRGMDYSKILNDPELMAAFQDPEVMAALQDVMKNPADLAKHQGNPKVAPIIAKMMSKFAGPQ